MKRVVTLIALATASCLRAEDGVRTATPVPILARRHVAALQIAFVPVGKGGADRAGVVLLATEAVSNSTASVAASFATISSVEAELLLAQLQADGFFKRSRVPASIPTGSGSAGYVIRLSGYAGAAEQIEEFIGSGAKAAARLRSLVMVLGPSPAPGSCESCRERTAMTGVGSCSTCGGVTRRGGFAFCRACAQAKGCCESCGRPLPLRVADLLGWLAERIESQASPAFPAGDL